MGFSFADLVPVDIFGDTFSGDDEVSGGPQIEDYLSGDEFGATARKRISSAPPRIVISGRIAGSSTGYASVASGASFTIFFQLGYKIRIRKVALLNHDKLVIKSIVINGVNQVLGGDGASGHLFDPANNVELLLKTIPANTLCEITGVNVDSAATNVAFGAFADVL
jgi:hypothetical protein